MPNAGKITGCKVPVWAAILTSTAQLVANLMKEGRENHKRLLLIRSHNWYLALRKQENQSKESKLHSKWASAPWNLEKCPPRPAVEVEHLFSDSFTDPCEDLYWTTTWTFCHWKGAHPLHPPFAVQGGSSCWCNCSLLYRHFLSWRRSWGDFTLVTSAGVVPCAWHSERYGATVD